MQHLNEYNHKEAGVASTIHNAQKSLFHIIIGEIPSQTQDRFTQH